MHSGPPSHGRCARRALFLCPPRRCNASAPNLPPRGCTRRPGPPADLLRAPKRRWRSSPRRPPGTSLGAAPPRRRHPSRPCPILGQPSWGSPMILQKCTKPPQSSRKTQLPPSRPPPLAHRGQPRRRPPNRDRTPPCRFPTGPPRRRAVLPSTAPCGDRCRTNAPRCCVW